jgi:hypothetical protein
MISPRAAARLASESRRIACSLEIGHLRAKIVDAESREQPKPAVKFSLNFFFEMVYFTG